jgi:hypothetical protein
MNLTKVVKDLYNEKYRRLKKGIKDIQRWKALSYVQRLAEFILWKWVY